MFKKITSVLVASIFVFSVMPADAAMMAYLTLQGQTHGAIKGSVTQKGREDSIAVIAFEHQVSSPIDQRTAQPTGKRQHGVIKVTKEVDKSSPILYSVWSTNERLTNVTLKFWAPQIKAATGTGQEVQMYTIKLTNARIVGIKAYMENIKHPESQNLPQSEEISFAYEKIEWTWNDGGITANDSWTATP